jgi:hypothetical protein
MARNGIHFQKGLSLQEFQSLYGTEAQCERPWRTRPGHMASSVRAVVGMNMASSTAGTIMEATKLPLTVWFRAFNLIGQGKWESSRLN